MTYDEIIEALEKATGPNRELDVAILTTVLGYRDVSGGEGYLFDRGNDGYWTLDGDEKNDPLPSPTFSVTTALTLVPEGHSFEFAYCVELKQAAARVFKGGMRENTAGEPRGHARYPALALCIAAVKARRDLTP